MVGRHYLNAIFWLAIAIGLVRAEAPHWSFQKGAMDPTPPKTGSPWAKTPIDSFILAKLDEQSTGASAGSRSPQFDPTSLDRRHRLATFH